MPSSRSHRRTRMGAAVVVLLIGLGVVLAGDPVAAQVVTPALGVTPATDLLDGQEVLVTGTGFVPGRTAYVSTCLSGATTIAGCDVREFRTSSVNGDGSFEVAYRVIRFLTTGAGMVDCVDTPCAIGASDDPFGPGNQASAAVSFADVPPVVPDVSMAPDADLVDGDVVNLVGTGFRSNEQVAIRQCPPGAAGYVDCAPDPTVVTYASSTGTVSTNVTVSRFLTSPTDPSARLDCVIAPCTIGIRAVGGFHTFATTFVEATLDVAIDPLGALDAATGEAVVRATVSCDRATSVALRAVISQLETEATATVSSQWCTPDQPLVAFLTGRQPANGSFLLGSVDVAVTAVPLRSFTTESPPTPTIVTSSVHQLDAAALRTAIGAAMADPANAALREAVTAAIRLRAAQDPIFAAELRAALAALVAPG